MSAILLPTPDNIQKAIGYIKQGGLVAYPTETVYGLGADPFNPRSIERLFVSKGRAYEKGLILLVRGTEDLPQLVSEIPPIAETLINAFWPGPLTLIFKAHSHVLPALLGGRNTIALRHSNHPVAQELLSKMGGPLTSTSANRSGEPPAKSAQELQTALGNHLDLILDGGPSSSSQPSTLIDISQNNGAILREGCISRQMLCRYLSPTDLV